ncbi:unnamed protein product, partial [Prorocentrum cordatum]
QPRHEEHRLVPILSVSEDQVLLCASFGGVDILVSVWQSERASSEHLRWSWGPGALTGCFFAAVERFSRMRFVYGWSLPARASSFSVYRGVVRARQVWAVRERPLATPEAASAVLQQRQAATGAAADARAMAGASASCNAPAHAPSGGGADARPSALRSEKSGDVTPETVTPPTRSVSPS